MRTVQPALEELDIELEEAAHSLGANRWTTWTRVIFPSILPAVLTGLASPSLARWANTAQSFLSREHALQDRDHIALDRVET